MLITQQFVDDFVRLIREADRGARLAPPTSRLQTASSMLPLYQQLEQARATGVDLSWDLAVKGLIGAIAPEKQRKYSGALKYVTKAMTEQQSNIFTTLRKQYQGGPLSEKLSKSQQRYIMPTIPGYEGHGLCAQMALMWLREQLQFCIRSRFPRIAGGNVVGSKAAQRLGREAFALEQAGQLEVQAQSLGLQLKLWHRLPTFQGFQQTVETETGVNAFFICFWNWQHAISVFRESATHCQFFDANAGSYRLRVAFLREFFTEYNNVCLPRKWPTYNAPAGTRFSGLYTVTQR